MSIFTKHTVDTAPAGASDILARVEDRYGFIPNLASYVAASPATLNAIIGLSENFDKSTLTPQEQQIVLITVSAMNRCNYCKTVHTALGRKAGVSGLLLKAILEMEELPDVKLNALRNFTREVVENRGWVGTGQVDAFLASGYSKAQVYEVVMGIALKTLTNYCNHLAGAEPNPEFITMAEA